MKKLTAAERIYWLGKRVEIPAHTDAWMRGDRYGTVESLTLAGQALAIRLDKSQCFVRFAPETIVRYGKVLE